MKCLSFEHWNNSQNLLLINDYKKKTQQLHHKLKNQIGASSHLYIQQGPVSFSLLVDGELLIAHFSHGFSPVCVRWWFFRLLLWVNDLPQTLHEYGLSSVCVRWWITRLVLWANGVPKMSHELVFLPCVFADAPLGYCCEQTICYKRYMSMVFLACACDGVLLNYYSEWTIYHTYLYGLFPV